MIVDALFWFVSVGMALLLGVFIGIVVGHWAHSTQRHPHE